ncbi:MAG: putative phosphothreonine lyase domain-containing protein [Candidatus Flexifilum sp.]|jgi:hypothetical protein
MSDRDAGAIDPRSLDLIARVQRARLEHDADLLPSQVSGVYWIECQRPAADPAPTARAGAFIIPARREHVDALWQVIRAATRRGELGYKSKVATAPRPSGDAVVYPIHVATGDAADEADCARVRAALIPLIAPFGLTADDLVYRPAR